MRDLVITQNITLDGVIDAAGGWFAPGDDSGDDLSDVLAALTAQREASDAFLTGRVTFEELRGFWPQRSGDETGIGDYLDRVRKYVVSTTLDDPEWQRSTVLGDLDDVRALKHRQGSDIVVTGSITLCHALVEAGLVDEYRLFTYPTVVGGGRRLFETTPVPRLTLEESRAFRSGITLTRYRSA